MVKPFHQHNIQGGVQLRQHGAQGGTHDATADQEYVYGCFIHGDCAFAKVVINRLFEFDCLPLWGSRVPRPSNLCKSCGGGSRSIKQSARARHPTGWVDLEGETACGASEEGIGVKPASMAPGECQFAGSYSVNSSAHSGLLPSSSSSLKMAARSGSASASVCDRERSWSRSSCSKRLSLKSTPEISGALSPRLSGGPGRSSKPVALMPGSV